MGTWASNASVGDIVGAQFGNLIFIFNGSWMEAILPFAIFQAAIALLFLFTIKDTPAEQFATPEILLNNYNNSNMTVLSLTH